MPPLPPFFIQGAVCSDAAEGKIKINTKYLADLGCSGVWAQELTAVMTMPFLRALTAFFFFFVACCLCVFLTADPIGSAWDFLAATLLHFTFVSCLLILELIIMTPRRYHFQAGSFLKSTVPFLRAPQRSRATKKGLEAHSLTEFNDGTWKEKIFSWKCMSTTAL